MKPYYEQDGITLYNADCRDILPELRAGMVFTSPPFKDEDVQGNYWECYDVWWRLIFQTAQNVACIVHSATKINQLMAKYPPKRLMIWGKGMSKYSWRFNPILVYQQNETYSVNRRIWSDCFAVPSLHGWMTEKRHKYQDPVNLYTSIFSMFKDAGIIVDPFCGSGTTLVGCKTLGRRGIGQESIPLPEAPKNA